MKLSTANRSRSDISQCILCLCSDRFRTMINVLGDALAAGIIAHLCRKDFPLSESGKVNTVNIQLPSIHVCWFDDSRVSFLNQ